MEQKDKDFSKFWHEIVDSRLLARLQLDPRGKALSLLDEIKSRITVEDILSAEGIELRRGRCRCPLHNGDNPTSFSVSKDGQVFFCFACHESGDLISFVRKLYGLDFKEAVRHLARKAGISEADFDATFYQRKQTHKIRLKRQFRRKEEHDALALSLRRWEKVLKELEQDMKSGKISLSKYFADQQLAEYQLARLDEESILRNYEKNVRRKEKWKRPC